MVKNIFIGLGYTVLYLLAGIILDYLITQALSQFVISDCSEDCYFRYFNGIFILVVVVSLLRGVFAGMQSYNDSRKL